jgi:hypothetical protein
MPFEDLYYVSQTAWEEKWRRARQFPFEGFPLPRLTCSALAASIGRWTSSEEGLNLSQLPQNVQAIAPVYGQVAASCRPYLEQILKNGQLAVKFVPPQHSRTLVFRKRRRPFAAGQTFYHARQFSMLEPLLTFCTGNPKYMSFEQANPACFPFSGYARRFFANILTLPAVPFTDIPQLEDASNLVVKIAALNKTTYVAVCNPSFQPIQAKVRLPVKNVNYVKPLVGAQNPVPFFVGDDYIAFSIALDAVELRSLKIE